MGFGGSYTDTPGLQPAVQYGLAANRPAASYRNAGCIYVADDTGAAWLSAAGKWVAISSGGSAPAPDSPSGVGATAGNAQVTVSWSANTGCASFNVYDSTAAASGPWTKFGNTASTSEIVTGLTNGTLYYFAVTGLSAGGAEGPYGSVVSATPVSPPPPPPPPPPSTWAFVQSRSSQFASSSSARTLAYTSNVTTGDVLLVAVGQRNSTGTVSLTVTDSQANTYTLVDTTSVSTSSLDFVGVSLYLGHAGSTGANTVTVTPGALTELTLAVHEHTPPTTGTLDAHRVQTGVGTNPTTGSMTATTTTEMVFGVFAQGDATLTTCPPGTGYTNRETQLSGSLAGLVTADQLNVNSGTYGASWTASASVNYAAVGAILK